MSNGRWRRSGLRAVALVLAATVIGVPAPASAQATVEQPATEQRRLIASGSVQAPVRGNATREEPNSCTLFLWDVWRQGNNARVKAEVICVRPVDEIYLDLGIYSDYNGQGYIVSGDNWDVFGLNRLGPVESWGRYCFLPQRASVYGEANVLILFPEDPSRWYPIDLTTPWHDFKDCS